MKDLLTIVLAQRWQLGHSHDLANGFSEYASAKTNWRVLLLNPNEVVNEDGRLIEADGFLLSSAFRQALEASNRTKPMVVTHWMPDEHDIYQVDSDPYAVGAFAADFLMRGNYHRLAVASSYHLPALNVRAKSFYERCLAAGQPCFAAIRSGAPQGDVIDDIMKWVRAGDLPVAVFTTEDRLACSLIDEVRQCGMHVPEEVSVLGCEDYRLICESVRPTLSSVHLPFRKVGFEAARMLDRQLQGLPIAERALYLQPDHVSERMSTCLFTTEDPQLRRALEFMHRNACDSASVTSAARHAGLTLRALQRRFRKELGHSPNHYLQHIRLEKAKQLLRETEMTMEEIASASGYESGHYLSRIFKAKIGQTARGYRNQFRRV